MTPLVTALTVCALASACTGLLSAPRSHLRWRLPVRRAEVRRGSPGVAVALIVGLVAVGLFQRYGGRLLVLGAVAAGTTFACRSLWMRSRERQAAARRRAAVVELCDALGEELAAGLPAGTAVERACSAWPEVEQLARHARMGDDVPAGLRRCASDLPGAEGLAAIAAGWQVSEQTGAALAAVLARVSAGLRSEQEAQAEVAAALGPPRATAKLLSALPLFGLALGASMGADPLGFLFGTSVGLVCLMLGVGLALLGIWWVDRLASAAED